ncbi:hypothetical protein [Cryptosporangium aurantiacum]|uniref:Uncharacterized protein n=1 Tax=Cryptosporangium aurantiacum TaxID=134849 RepID=A0A1M7PBJ2_9ACTN|nr:hypothetical protein [Cryptosporangium aurantiacum]SHN14166.1 hypothetical protein SAMN05443668_103160 [Cryptosporangium aurantiacum]
MPERSAHLEIARLWLAGRGLTDVPPTPWLAARLTVRRRARLAASTLVALFLCGVALIYVTALPTGEPADELRSLLVLMALVVVLVLAQALLDRWVRHVDRQASEQLPQRAAHTIRPGWRTVLGLPRAALLVTTYIAATTLAIGTLIVRDSTDRYPPVILLIGLCGVAIGTVIQLRHVLTHPVVADDEGSLAADLHMRVEDARELAMPTAVWSLPVVSVFSAGLDPWNTAWLVFIVLSIIALLLITAWTGRSTLAAARHATSAR